MKVRKLAVALALAGGLGSSLAQALGLGEAQLKSNLNEPLQAEIELVSPGDLTRDEIIASLASREAFSQAGLDRAYYLNSVDFSVVRTDQGKLAIRLTSDKPLREPYISFLMEVAWPSGRLMREYSFLVDPPTYSEEPAQPVSAPTASQQPSTTQARQPEPQPQQRSTAGTQTRGEYGPTRASDTLWSIAEQVRPNQSVSTQQVMLALQDLNPDAFIGNNINRLKRGQVLRTPTLDDVQRRTAREAIQQVVAQNRRFKSATQQTAVDATQRKSQQAPSTSGAAQGDELKLVVDETGKKSTEGTHGGGIGGTGEGEVSPDVAVAMEQVDKVERENEDLQNQVQDLEEQLNTLQQLMKLKDDQLAQLQQQMKQEGIKPETQGQPGSEGAGGEATAEAPEQTAAAEAQAPAESQGEPTVDQAAGETAAEAESMAQEGEAAAPEQPAQEEAAATEQPAAQQPAETEQQAQAEPETAMTQPAETQPEVQTEPEQPKEETFTTRSFFDQLVSNPMYQIGAGGVGIGILAFLWWLARRNAAREKSFYEQLQSEEEGLDTDSSLAAGSFDTEADTAELAEEEKVESEGEGEDVIGEADVYLAYGRLDQAAQVLEEAISKEPSRSDLRLKLLEVYAEHGDKDSFEKQVGEVKALGDEEALNQAMQLREKLAEADQMPSIDDLESQLKADVQRGGGEDEFGLGGDSLAEEERPSEADKLEEAAPEEEDLSLEWDLSEEAAGTVEEAEDKADEAAEQVEEPEKEEDHGMINFDTADLGLEEETSEEEPVAEAGETEGEKEEEAFDFSLDTEDLEETTSEDVLSDEELDSLDLESEFDAGEGELPEEEEDFSFDDLDFEETVSEKAEEPEAEEPETGLAEEEAPKSDEAPDIEAELEESLETPEEEGGDFDDSFLEELDAELDKVTEEGEEDITEEKASGDELDDLELDVSDDDLALIEEVAGDEETEGLEPPSLEEESAEEGAAEESDESEALGLADEEPLLDMDLDEPETATEGEPAEPLEELGETETPEETPEEAIDSLAEEPEEVVDETQAEVEEPDLESEFDDSILEEASEASAETESVETPDTDLGEDEDFDFLAGTDEAATKLDLARAYIEMGDSDGARDILEEVALEGSDEQKQEAQTLLKKLS
ncbi:FimV/HubP family polar landmark protein [Marinobacteraceae bacterium S3BR75-40.1]